MNNSFLILMGLLLGFLLVLTVLLTAHLSQPRKPIARAGGDLASQQRPAGGEVAVRHPVKDQGRVPQ